MNRIKEEWWDIPGYEGYYQASTQGRIKSVDRTVRSRYGTQKCKGTMLTPAVGRNYYRVTLVKEGSKKLFTVHRLVATTFLPNPDNLPQVNHKDENKLNNCVDNLEWCTQQYNLAYGSGRERLTDKTRKAVMQINQFGNVIAIYRSTQEAARITGFSQGHISMCCTGKASHHNGYLWRYIQPGQTVKLSEIK